MGFRLMLAPSAPPGFAPAGNPVEQGHPLSRRKSREPKDQQKDHKKKKENWISNFEWAKCEHQSGPNQVDKDSLLSARSFGIVSPSLRKPICHFKIHRVTKSLR